MAIEELTDEQAAFLEGFVLGKAPAAPESDKRYPGLLKTAQALRDRVGKLPITARSLLQVQIDELGTKLTEAKALAEDGESGRATEILTSATPTMRGLRQDMPMAATYAEEAGKFQARLKEARSRQGGDGGVAIADYIERLEADEDRRASAEARGDLRMALTACEAMDNIHAAKMQDADRGREFLDLQAGIEADIARLEQSAPADEGAAQIISEAREMMNDARNFTKSDNWVGAVIMMRNARNELKVGTASLDLKKKLATDDGGSDFETADNAFGALFKGICSMRGANTFTKQLRDSCSLAAGARDKLPDTNAALNQLGAAANQCQALLQPILAHARYQTESRSILAQHKVLKKQNRDTCAKTEVKQSAQMIKQAASRAKNQDFDSALGRLKEAGETIANGVQASRIYQADVKGARLAIAGVLKAQPEFENSDQLRQLFDQISKSYDQRDLKASTQLAAQAQEICARV